MPLAAFAPIQTPRLTVRLVQPEDLPGLMKVNGDDDATRFLPYASWRTLDDAQAWFDRMAKLAESGTVHQLVIVRNEDSQPLGTALLFKWDEGSARIELGYVIGPPYWRQGYASEALRAVLRRAFGELGIRRVEAEVNPANMASCKLLLSLGFTHEGVLRKRWAGRDGEPYDINIYGLLAGEGDFSQ